MVMSAREEAVRQLRRISGEGAYRALIETSADLEARDRRYATELVSGVTRWRRRLDFLIDHFFKGDPEKLEESIRYVLRIGLYELLILETPPHAAVNEAVDLARRLSGRGASGLTNGILRSVLRQRDQLPEPKSTDDAENIAILGSHPTWIVRRWLQRLGVDETRRLIQWNNARPVYGVRINTVRIDRASFIQKLDELEIEHEPSPFLDDFVRVRTLQPLIHANMIRDGLCVVQDEAAGLVVHLLSDVDGLVVDACAAPGGKALYAAQTHDRRVVAVDVHAGRTKLIGKAAARLGLDNVEVKAGDAEKLAEIVGKVDAVLLDAPCSGFGVMNKRADLRWRRTPEQIEELIALQARLLDGAAEAVAPGGLLVYATCSIEPEENEQQVERFLQRNTAFQLETVAGFVPDELVSEAGYYQALPYRHGIDGAFGARLRRLG